MKPNELQRVLKAHAKWIAGEPGGERAYLAGANLVGADLAGANLVRAYLADANLVGADLADANLAGAYLAHAYLAGAYLIRANLAGANLVGADLALAYLAEAYLVGADLVSADLAGANLAEANLAHADLAGANLAHADLVGADLVGAYLAEANLVGADLAEADLPPFQVPHGELVVYKKVAGKIVRLRIPEKARRTGSLIGRKCRAEYAVVEWIEDGESVTSGGCGHDSIRYMVGETVYPDSYDPDIRVECSHGVHFFLTRQEAEQWQ